MNQRPPERALSDRLPNDKTLLERIHRELWPSVQDILRTLRAFLPTTPLSVTSDTTIDGTEDLILVDASAGNVTITLPTAETWMKAITVVKMDATANTVTVSSVSFADPVLAAQGDSAMVMQDGTAFYAV